MRCRQSSVERTRSGFITLRKDASSPALEVSRGRDAGGAARDPKVTKQVSIILDDTGSNALTATTVNRYEQASQSTLFKSSQYFGSGANAFHLVIASANLYRSIVDSNLKGVTFKPCSDIHTGHL